jgi:DNA-binding MarR family transcriptional regulator
VPDAVDAILAQWADARPDLDPSPMAVIGRISQAARLIDQHLKVSFEVHGLDAAGFDVLATLRRTPGHRLSPSELMHTAMVTSGAITQRLDKLEARGLVLRSRSDADGRGWHVTLTAAGKRLVDRALPDHLATEERLLANLSGAQRAALAGALRTFILGNTDG